MIAIFPQIAECATKGDPERLAVMVRKYFGGKSTYAPALDIIQIYNDMGIGIRHMPLEGVAALIGKDESGRFSVSAFLNPSAGMNKEEETFTLAHLLGHYFFDMQPQIARGEWHHSGVKEHVSPQVRYSINGIQSDDRKDRLADQFAACLLLPQALVARAAPKFGSTQKMAQFFGVDIKVLTRRALELGCTLPDLPDLVMHHIPAGPQKGKAPKVKSYPEPTRATSGATLDQQATPKSDQQELKRELERANQSTAPRESGMARIRQIAKQLDKSL